MLFNNKQHYLWAILVIAVGNILQLNALGLLDVSIWRLVWPTIVIVIGVSIIANRVGSTKDNMTVEKASKSDRDCIGCHAIDESDEFFSVIAKLLAQLQRHSYLEQ